jgi:hypothetical protein
MRTRDIIIVVVVLALIVAFVFGVFGCKDKAEAKDPNDYDIFIDCTFGIDEPNEQECNHGWIRDNENGIGIGIIFLMCVKHEDCWKCPECGECVGPEEREAMIEPNEPCKHDNLIDQEVYYGYVFCLDCDNWLKEHLSIEGENILLSWKVVSQTGEWIRPIKPEPNEPEPNEPDIKPCRHRNLLDCSELEGGCGHCVGCLDCPTAYWNLKCPMAAELDRMNQDRAGADDLDWAKELEYRCVVGNYKGESFCSECGEEVYSQELFLHHICAKYREPKYILNQMINNIPTWPDYIELEKTLVIGRGTIISPSGFAFKLAKGTKIFFQDD